jgi:subtilisin family serine protease
MAVPRRERIHIAAGHVRRALALGAAALALAPAAASAAAPAPLVGTGRPGAIAGRYVVVMKAGTAVADRGRAERAATARGAKVDRVFGTALSGYAAALSPAALAAVRSDSDVAYVEADATVSLATTQVTNDIWNLDQLDQRTAALDGTYTYATTGAGVTAYVIDTGIRFSHQEFGGRARAGADVFGGTGDDCYGHGTNVAGVIGGATYGVAKQVGLVSVRVVDCAGHGTTSQAIAGVDWVTSDHLGGQPAVANMSLGYPASDALDQAVAASIADGVAYAVAAGNSSADACAISPARAANALTVGAVRLQDAGGAPRAVFSNYGTCLDMFAPGQSIASPGNLGDTHVLWPSGTSFASPHVAGAAALYLENHRAATPGAVGRVLTDSATTDLVRDAGAGSPNRLLFTGAWNEAGLTAVPRVREEFRAPATQMVRDAGLVPYYTGSTSPSTWVASQSPAPGTVVARGSTVTLRMQAGQLP